MDVAQCVDFDPVHACCPSLRMTTMARGFVIEDCDDHDRSRVVVCTTNVHIVCLVESGMRDGL